MNAVASVLGAEPYTPADWVLIITALTTFVTTCAASIGALVVSIRNGKKADSIGEKADAAKTAADEVKLTAEATATKVDAVHDCLHRQAAEVKAIVATVPGAAEVVASQQSAEAAPA